MTLQQELLRKQQVQAEKYINETFVSLNDVLGDIEEFASMAHKLCELKQLPIVQKTVQESLERIEVLFKEPKQNASALKEELMEIMSVGAFVKEAIQTGKKPNSDVGNVLLKETRFSAKRMPVSANREELFAAVKTLTKEQRDQVLTTVGDFGYPVFF